MRLAVVGWAADSGVGRELVEAVRHLPVTSAFVLPNRAKPTRRDLLAGLDHHLASGPDLDAEMRAFVESRRPDTVLTWEVPGSWGFPDVWRARGIRWVHVVHWDWFAPAHDRLWRGAALVSPNRMCQRELKSRCGLDSTYLPVPVDTGRIRFRRRERCELLVSVYGYGGLADRRSLPEVFAAWRGMAAPPPLLIRAQVRPPEAPTDADLPEGIAVEVSNLPEPADLYGDGDVALQPSRYEGVGISMLEAQAAGMPVIAAAAPPMDEFAPDLPVPVARTTTVSLMGKDVASHVPSVEGLRAVVERIAGADVSDLSDRARARVEERYSWDALRSSWVDILSGAR